MKIKGVRKGERVLLKEEIQIMKKTREWEPPYGILILTQKKLIIACDGEMDSIPVKKIKEMEMKSIEKSDYNRIFGKNHIRISYTNDKDKKTPYFSCTHGSFGGTLRMSRDRKTEDLYGALKDKIENLKKI